MFIEVYIVAIAYIIASINPSIIISNKIMGTDIRKMGSKNAGTTNMLRMTGLKWGTFVFLLDIIKVVISYLLILFVATVFKLELTSSQVSLFVLAVVVGHCFPFYYSFKGGKGIVVLLTSMMIADYQVTLFCLMVGIVLILITRMVSIAAIIGNLLIVIIVLCMNTKLNHILTIMTVSIIIFKHRGNIQRILKNNESKLFEKNKS